MKNLIKFMVKWFKTEDYLKDETIEVIDSLYQPDEIDEQWELFQSQWIENQDPIELLQNLLNL